MRIILSPDAITDIEDIYRYYFTYSEKTAARNCSKILDEIKVLERFPMIGGVDFLLMDKTGKYRCYVILKGKIKVIYKVENDLIYVAGIWDCRKNPETLKQKL